MKITVAELARMEGLPAHRLRRAAERLGSLAAGLDWCKAVPAVRGRPKTRPHCPACGYLLRFTPALHCPICDPDFALKRRRRTAWNQMLAMADLASKMPRDQVPPTILEALREGKI